MELFKDCMILERRLSHLLLLIAHTMLPSQDHVTMLLQLNLVNLVTTVLNRWDAHSCWTQASSIISRLMKFHQQLEELCMLVDGLFQCQHFQSSAPESSEVENDIPDPIHSVTTNTSSSQGNHFITQDHGADSPLGVVILYPPRIFTPLLFWLYCLLIPIYQYVVILHFSELLSAVSDEDPLFFEQITLFTCYRRTLPPSSPLMAMYRT